MLKWNFIIKPFHLDFLIKCYKMLFGSKQNIHSLALGTKICLGWYVCAHMCFTNPVCVIRFLGDLRWCGGRAPGRLADQKALVILAPDGDAHISVAHHAAHAVIGLVHGRAQPDSSEQQYQGALHCWGRSWEMGSFFMQVHKTCVIHLLLIAIEIVECILSFIRTRESFSDTKF